MAERDDEGGAHRTQLVLVKSDARPLAARRPDLAEAARAFAEAARAKNTRRAQRFDLAVFYAWCAAQNVCALPADVDTAIGFLTDQAKTKSVATLVRYRATIGKFHKMNGHPSPFADERVKMVLEGVRRTYGTMQRRVAPLPLAVAAARRTGPHGVRDRALMLVGFAGALRGEELCSIDVSDLSWSDDQGVAILLRHSKTDQAGEGVTIGVPYRENPDVCPVRALRDWLDLLRAKEGRRAEEGPLFRGVARNGALSRVRLNRSSVNAIVKRAVGAAGLDPNRYGAHSMRAGYVTAARRAGFSWEVIMTQTRHKRIETVKRYDRGTIDPFKASRVAEVLAAAEKEIKKP